MIRRVAAGLTSLLILAVLAIGAPIALWHVTGVMLARGIPDLSVVLFTPDNGTVMLWLVLAIGWMAWAYLAAAVMLELVAQIRHVPLPRLPAFAPARLLVGPLVTAVVVMLSLQPVAAIAAPTTPTHTGTTGPVAVQTVQKTAAEQGYTSHVVGPKDTLTGLAKQYLGSASRWQEIYDASTSIRQADGRHLTNPDLIVDGWTLHIPTGTTTTTPAAAAVPSSVAEATTPAAATPPAVVITLPGATATAVPSTVAAPATTSSTTTNAATPRSSTASSSQSAPAPAVSQIVNAPAEDPMPWRTTAGIGALLGAGILLIVARLRTLQQRRRPKGTRIAMPTTPVAELEAELAAVADPIALDDVDRALRQISAGCAATGQPLPQIRAARLTDGQLELYLTEPVPTMPSPWQATSDATVWYATTTDLTRPHQLTADLAAVAPYPTLVSIGHDAEHGLVLLDLEQIGSLAVTGDPTTTREVLAALAMELAIAPWADDLQVTIVGAYPELGEALGTGRIRYLPSIDRLLDSLTERAQADRNALAEAGAEDLSYARTHGLAPDAWTPEIILVDGPVTARHRNLLDALVTDLPRVAIAVITTDDLPLGEWVLHLDSPDTATLDPIGLDITPQRVGADAYSAILELIATTSDPATPRPDPVIAPTIPLELHALDSTEDETSVDEQPTETAAAIRTPAAVTLIPIVVPKPKAASEGSAEPLTTPDVPEDAPSDAETAPVPSLRLLGPIQVMDATDLVESGKVRQLTEYMAYLLLNPGSTRESIDDAIWPNRSTENNTQTRNTAHSKLRRWLGKDPAGRDWLPTHSGYTIRAEVTTDWHQYCDLLPHGPESATTDDLEAALSLVRGRPFEGADRKRWGWKEPVQQTMIADIADAAIELAHRRMMEGRWADVEKATTIGITVAPSIERLWRLRILAAHQSGNDQAEAEAIDRLETLADALGCPLDPETITLLENLANSAPYPVLQEAAQ